MNDTEMHGWTPAQIIGRFESAVNELKANRVAMASDVDGRSGYGVVVDHIVFCALLRDDKIFMEMSHSIVEIRRPDMPPEFRTAFYYGPIGLFLFVP